MAGWLSDQNVSTSFEDVITRMNRKMELAILYSACFAQMAINRTYKLKVPVNIQVKGMRLFKVGISEVDKYCKKKHTIMLIITTVIESR